MADTGKRQAVAEAVLDFGSVAAQSSGVLTATVPQVNLGDVVMVQAPTNVAQVASQGTLTMDTQPTDNDTMTIGTRVYTYKDTLTGVADEISTGADLAGAQANTVAALNATGTAGTNYSVGTTINTDVSAGAFAANASIFTAKVPGAGGDSIATTETFTAGTNVFDAATLGTTRAGADTSAVVVDGVVTAEHTVTVRLTNPTASAFDADSGTYKIVAWTS